MKTLDYTIRFVTPAFLGNAEQAGQWRSPPFKALLRQWWRVAYAAEKQFQVDPAAMRKEEGLLFGHAWLEDDRDEKGNKVPARRSQVRIRLSKWNIGDLKQAPAIGRVAMGKNQIPAELYSGYGPVAPGPKLKGTAAIQAGDEAQLRIAFPKESKIEQALALMNAYGTLGGRSRNGWGSLELRGEHVELKPAVRDWEAAMQMDWPHALGKDDRTLIWQSSPLVRWEDAMKLLAQVRADMRRAVPDRLMLAYPSTKGTMPGWGNSDRVPHSLRFKVRPEGAQFVAVIFHMPCRPADALWKKLTRQKQQGFPATFAAAHAFLDRQQHFKRVEV